METSVTAGIEVGSKCFCDPLCRQIGYLCNLKKNFKQLKKEVGRLDNLMKDVQRETSGQKATNACEGWLREADDIQRNWQKVEEEYENNKMCLGGRCPNVSISRLKLGKCVAALIKETDDCIKNSKFKRIADEPQQIMELPPPTLQGNTAADRTLRRLLSMLEEPSINIIGLWGMGGVGKTTIMRALHSRPEIVQRFEMIIWITVSKEGDNRYVQKELAIRLNVHVESNDALKSKIFTVLKNKKFLLLLDDVWDKIDLEELGVPPLAGANTGCNLVLSTRFRSVCCKMRTNKEIEVESLSAEEAWSLFRREVGEVADNSLIEDLAIKVAMECGGLPLAIVVIAGALRNEQDIHVWRNALEELSSAGEIQDMEKNVYRRLKFSYDRLKDKRLKECFLYCALFPEDYQIQKSQLIKYWINERLIDGWSKLQKAEDKGFSNLKELMDASLVEKGMFHEWVKMHDVMRDLALRISSTEGEGPTSLVKSGVKLSEVPNVEDWEEAKKISLMFNDLESLPPMPPNCHSLTTLLLEGNSELREIPPDFFLHMPALQVLDLSSTGIRNLPPSIGCLANLRGLYLNDCEFLNVIPGEVGALLKLEIFEMKEGTEVRCLPPEIGDLASLRLLDVNCGPPRKDQQVKEEEMPVMMKMFPRMTKLSRLERLGICTSPRIPVKWWATYHSEGVSKDISMLNQLTHLLLIFSTIEHFECFVQQSSSCWNQLTTFRLLIQPADSAPKFILRDWDSFCSTSDNRVYKVLRYGAGVDELRGAMIYNDDTKKTVFNEILTRLDFLAIGDHVAVRRLSEFGLEKMKELKHCHVIGCKYIETIDDDYDDDAGGNGKQNSDLLPNLKRLVLWELPNLEGIWKVPSPSPQRKYFRSLKFLEFNRCPRLKRLLSRGHIPHLSNLEELVARYCWEVEEIISTDKEDGDEETVPPRLQKLYLQSMPKLTSICSNKEFPALQEIEISGCRNLRSLPQGFPEPKYLKGGGLERLVRDVGI